MTTQPPPTAPAFELGIYSFGNTRATGGTAQAIRNVLEAVHVGADGDVLRLVTGSSTNAVTVVSSRSVRPVRRARRRLLRSAPR